MRTILLVSVALAAVAFVSPAADARQVCVYDGRTDPCDDHLVCWYNNFDLEPRWVCYGHVDPCLFRCWLP